jgi:hypothetical protein
MKFNLKNAGEVERARAYLELLIEKQSLAEVIKVSPRRSLNQNSYLHLLLNAFGLHFGYTSEEAKLIYKELNKNVYAYDKRGRTFYRSSADLTKEEMAQTIDRFRDASAAQGYPLPLATDQGWLREIENAIEQAKYYL